MTLKKKNYALSKLICENLITEFSENKKINYVIARIFNMYGYGDNFSIISKIIKSYKSNHILNLANKGMSIRDFIHVGNVAKTYKSLQSSNFSGVIDIGIGNGYKISDIVNKLGRNNFKIRNYKIEEEEISIARKFPNIFSQISNKNYLENYLKKELKIKKSIVFSKFQPTNQNNNSNTLKGTIIYGAGNAGKQLFDILCKENNEAVFCFVDDNKKLNGKLCRNKKILSFNQLVKLSQQYHIPNIIIAIPSIKRQILIKLIDKLNPLALNINFLSLKKITNDKIYLSDIINGNLINFLGRKISVIDKKLLNNLNNKVILITGAGGSIGSELCKQLSKLKVKKIIALDNSELNFYNIQKNDYINNKIKLVLGNILDKKLIKFLDQKYKIDIIFHAAAYKHVNILEDNIYQAVENNIFGTLNLLETFKEKKKEFILISTDKAANPRNNLGFTKRISEIIAQNYSSKLKINIVRFGNVFGSQGSAINLFIDQINYGGPVTITNKNVKRYFMSINEACNLVIQSSQLKENSKIFILKMGNQIKLIDIIKKLINYKKIKDPSSKINIKEIGIKKSEKIRETLSLSNKFFKTSHPDILIADEPRYSSSEIKNFISELLVCFNKIDDKKIKLCLTKFLKKEI